MATSAAVTQNQIQVPLLDLKAQYRELETEILETLKQVCADQRFILGPSVQELEAKVAEYSGCKFGIGVSSGTDALLVALMALDIGAGDEVITSPYTFFATGGAVARLGARPIYCDIDPKTYNLSAAAVEAFIKDRCDFADGQLINKTTKGKVKVMIPVHLYGQMADMDALVPLAKKYGLKIVEDAAQAIGSEVTGGRRAGALGDIGCFSFFPSKNLGAFGDGGMCTTNDPDIAERLKVLRVHGGKPKYYHQVVGGNFRLDEMQAAVLLIKLRHLDRWTEGRQANAAFYDAAFAPLANTGKLSTPVAIPGYRHIYNQYVLRVQKRDELQKALSAAGIGTEIYYPVPLHMQKCFAYLNYRPEDCPESTQAANETIAVPIYPELNKAQKQHVVDIISGFYA